MELTHTKLEKLIIEHSSLNRNLPPVVLLEQAIKRNEGVLSSNGALVVRTGIFTGRSPRDKFIVDYGNSDIWWGEINQPILPEVYATLLDLMVEYLSHKTIYFQEMRAGADSRYAINLNILTEKAWSALFCNNLFIRLNRAETSENYTDPFTIIHCPEFLAPVGTPGLKSQTFIVLNLQERTILIGGSAYAGEIKKSVFSIMNYLLPQSDVLSMHCSANLGTQDDVALFFGLSGTGKTTLSSERNRLLIGDDEHGWSDEGIFNIEGGCYAKTINLREQYEPMIWQATHRLSTVLENVVIDENTRELNFDDASLTENTRAAYPINYIERHAFNGTGGHPKNIFFLSADASGVLPPISSLSEVQAIYYFLSGYTSKLAGTERDLGSQPQPTFSACFGAPFLPLHPRVYCEMLGKKLRLHLSKVWLINTGWTGGPYCIGKRIPLPYTRAMINAALSGDFDTVSFRKDGYFGLMVPENCPDVPNEILCPINTWSSKYDYEHHTHQLISHFWDNYNKYRDMFPEEVGAAGPQLGQ